LPMDETTPPVTKIYLVSLIYTPTMEPEGHSNLLHDPEKERSVGY
jgi:hypothetical protein